MGSRLENSSASYDLVSIVRMGMLQVVEEIMRCFGAGWVEACDGGGGFARG